MANAVYVRGDGEMTENEAIKAIKSNRPTSGYIILNEALGMAINALEKQIPKKIVRVKLRPTEWGSGFRCPECEAEQTETEFFGYGKSDNKITFCWGCGQKLDFGE